MRRQAAGALLLLLISWPTVASADYDKTQWGMSLADVQRRYPGGAVLRLQTGEIEYSVARTVGAEFPALTTFFFVEGKLEIVMLHVIRNGTVANLEAASCIPPVGEEAERAKVLLEAALRKKYGTPVPDLDHDGRYIQWKTIHDLVSLHTRSSHSGIDVEIDYQPVHYVSDFTKGL